MELILNKRLLAALGGLLLMLLFGGVGHAVTPPADDAPELLTPERWQTAQLARRAGAEIVRLGADVKALHALAASDHPDAIAAMTLAERVYAANRRGTAATAPARQATIAAAEAVARWAGGGLPRAATVAALNEALGRVQVLTARQAYHGAADDYRYRVYLPLAIRGDGGGPVTGGAATDAVRAGAAPAR
jgi:hypothetical protein